MSKLLDQIRNCNVEWKPLGEVIHSLKTGLNPRNFFKLNTDDANNFYVTIRELKSHTIIFNENTDKINNEALRLCNNRSNLEVGDILFSGTGTIGNVAIIEKQPMNWNIKEGVYAIKPKQDIIDSKFLLYLFESENIRKDFLSRSAGGTVKSVPMKELAKILIPIPPFSLQSEIVRILDIFTAITSELTNELSLRKKQYQYYRDKLLSFGDDVEWKTLGEVAKYEQPTKYLVQSSDYHDDFDTPVLTAGKTFILGYTDETDGIYKASQNPVIIFDDFTTANKWVDFDFKAKSSAMKMITSADENKVLLKFIYYWLNTLPSELASNDHKRQWISNFAKKLIPIPPLAEQQRIVEILDKFDTLVNSLTEGLPKEIELRQKQYEYYRGLLLDFPKSFC
ncbi:restriction endonuclease subunit S [Lonepinella sp. BR2271]|uniref:restriction endonuclease subunit S n=1 Tax=Lonepinella sp. BR2271 TaxID=3434550 RepID=UPI003F6E1C3A